jgi:hypothetical protein
MQVSQSKLTVLKNISIKIFGEFMEFFPKGLDPFKIQIVFCFPNFYFKFCWEFDLLFKRKVVPFEIFIYLAMFANFWRSIRIDFVFFQIRAILFFGKGLENLKN